MKNYCATIHDFITQEETKFAQPIKINESWDWSMKDHLLLSELYTNAQLKNGKDDWTPIKNITLPILNLQHRAEDIEMKDVQLYVNNGDDYHLSLLVKKYHDDVFVRENDIDTYFDDLNVSRIDLGGGLSKKLNKACPEVVPLQSIVFCNQRDMLASPFAIKHSMSPEELLRMSSKGWGNPANGATLTIEEVIRLWREQEKVEDGIEVYETHGTLPAIYADPNASDMEYNQYIFITCFYQAEGEKQGVILYSALENVADTFKLIKRDKIYGRALGRGGAEELFEPQVWTTYDMIRKQKMLDAAAVTILSSDDPTIRAKNPKGLKGMKNLEIVDLAPNTTLQQVDTFPRNMQLFDKSLNDWEMHAQNLGGAQDPLMGKEPTAGTPFASVEAQIQQGMGLHDYRRGQFAKHIEEIYTDWIIPHIKKEITKGFRFLSELTLDELTFVATRLEKGEWIKKWNQHATDKILSEQPFEEGEYDAFIAELRDSFHKSGNKHFLEALKNDFKAKKLGVKVSVAGKSKNLGKTTDKIVNLFRFAFSNPQGFAQVMQIPGMSKSWNEILEFSGMSQANFAGIDKLAQQPQQPQAPQMPQSPELPVEPS